MMKGKKYLVTLPRLKKETIIKRCRLFVEFYGPWFNLVEPFFTLYELFDVVNTRLRFYLRSCVSEKKKKNPKLRVNNENDIPIRVGPTIYTVIRVKKYYDRGNYPNVNLLCTFVVVPRH